MRIADEIKGTIDLLTAYRKQETDKLLACENAIDGIAHVQYREYLKGQILILQWVLGESSNNAVTTEGKEQ